MFANSLFSVALTIITAYNYMYYVYIAVIYLLLISYILLYVVIKNKKCAFIFCAQNFLFPPVRMYNCILKIETKIAEREKVVNNKVQCFLYSK